VRKVVNVYLRLCGVSRSCEVGRRKSNLVCAGGHDPVAIFAHSHTLAGFFKVEILQQLHAVRKLGIVLQAPRMVLAHVLVECDVVCAPFAPSYQPLRQRARLAAADGVHGHRRVGNLHGDGRVVRCGGTRARRFQDADADVRPKKFRLAKLAWASCRVGLARSLLPLSAVVNIPHTA
jgi:hypothetical protein